MGAFAEATGHLLGPSAWLTVRQHQIDHFATIPDAGHEYLALSLMPPLLRQVYSVDRVAMRLNYGTGRIRFAGTLRADDRVRVRARLMSTSPARVGRLFRLEAALDREGSAEPACLAEMLMVLVGNPETATVETS